MKRREIPVMNVGISLLILIFMNLCLAAFAVLSLENAMSDYSLSEKTAEHTTQYYEGVNKLQKQIADADAKLQELWEATESPADTEDESAAEKNREKSYYKKIKKAFKDSYTVEDGKRTLYFTETISEEQQIAATLLLSDPQSGTFYQIETWQVQSVGDWEADQSLDVYQAD